MPSRILHVLDSTTPGDALEMLAHLIAPPPTDQEIENGASVAHRLVTLGHRSTGDLAALAGIAPRAITWVRSMGWADPSGWRGLRQIVRDFAPTHLHAWGACAAVAVSRSGFAGPRLATFADLPGDLHLRLLRNLERGMWPASSRESASHWTWIATSESLGDRLVAGGLSRQRMTVIRPGISARAMPDCAAIRKDLGILPGDGPVLLMAGEGRHARGDYAIWTAAIIQQILPRIRIILKPDIRTGHFPGLERFFNTLPDDDMLVLAPRELSWPALMPAADILLVAANAPIPVGGILQAMAAGLPVVATPIDAITEIIADGKNGLLAKAVGHSDSRETATSRPRALAARLEELLRDAPLAAALGANARESIRARYDLPTMLRSYRRLYRELARADGAALPHEIMSM